MIKRLLACVCVFLSVIGLTGCGDPRPKPLYGMAFESAEVAGPGTLGLSVPNMPIKGLIVYFHGSDQNARFIEYDRRHTDLFDPFLRAGYAVVASDAQGNAYGNFASRQDYRRLIVAAQKKYGEGPLFFVAESMGALAALALLSEDSNRHVVGMVGISPLMGLPPESRTVSYINYVWGNHGIPPIANPLAWQPETFAGRRFRLYAAKDDKVIPPVASARAFADRFGTVAQIQVIDCTGGHVSSDCTRGPDAEKWISGLSWFG